MLKKTTLLSIATAAAVITTSVGTFAAYDTVEAATNASNITIRRPVTVTVGKALTAAQTETSAELGSEQAVVEGTVTFTVSDPDKLADQLTLVPTITGDNVGDPLSASDFDIVITDVNDLNTPLDGFVDKTLTSTEYKVTATLKEGSYSKISDTNDNIKIELTGTLSKSES